MPTRIVPDDEIAEAQRLGRRAVLEGDDYLHVRRLPDGRAIYLLPMLHDNVRVAIGDVGSLYLDDGWCYQAGQVDLAWRAALGWNGEGEPEGWYRHPDTGRRRPGGDPAQEYVHK